MLKSNGFYVSPSVLPDIDQTVLMSNFPSAQATYKVLDVDQSDLLDSKLTFSLTMNSDIKLTDYDTFTSILENSYINQSTGNYVLQIM